MLDLVKNRIDGSTFDVELCECVGAEPPKIFGFFDGAKESQIDALFLETEDRGLPGGDTFGGIGFL